MLHKRIPRLRTPSEYQALGRAVRELRICRELSQEALGHRCHMHRNHVGAVERGEANPRFDCILRLISALDVTLVELVAMLNRHHRPDEYVG
jgi:ribosome-binding protein aMBF1 (putative translation factor)